MALYADDLKPGDIVRVRSWDDIADEFGDPYNIWFTREMSNLSGTEFTVYEVDLDDNQVWLVEDEENRWEYRSEMFELVRTKEQDEAMYDEEGFRQDEYMALLTQVQ